MNKIVLLRLKLFKMINDKFTPPQQINKWYHNGVRADVVHLLPTHYSKILEIGGGDGAFRQCLKNTNEYWGIEPYEPAANIAKTVLDKVLVGTYDEVSSSLPDNYFDLVLCFDVMEHMAYPELFLQSVKGKMTSNGFIVASIPNIRYIFALKEILIDKDWRYRERGIFDNTHLRFFTKKSAIRLLENNGFNIEQIDGLSLIKWHNLLKQQLFHLIASFIGKDIKYLQFGIRATLR